MLADRNIRQAGKVAAEKFIGKPFSYLSSIT